MTDDLKRDRQFLLHSLHSRAAQEQARIWTRGRGAVLYDQHGNEVLDALAGLWNVVLGHGRAELADAAARQMRELPYATCYAGSSNPRAIELGETLAGICYPSIQRFFFTSGGAEANESAFKTARYFWKMNGRPDKTKIIGRRYGYHGTTLATMSATGLSSYWPVFEPRVPGFSHIDSPYPYRFNFAPRSPDDQRTPGEAAADLLEEEIIRQGADTVAAFIGEPVQGAGGVIVPPGDYWPRIRQICDRHNVLLIADEVITGFGRTGEWFALSRYGIEPDIVSFAKAITSGYFPLGGIGVNERIAAAIDAGADATTWMHAFTYSAHPVGCAVALETLRILQAEGLVQRAAELGKRLLAGLRTLGSHPHVGDVRGLGLMAAVELVADKSTKAEYPPEAKVGARLLATALRRGMFTRMRGEVYNLAPCFVAEERQIDRMVEILGEAIDEVAPAVV
jgi:adenosylmethionine-8-amino-7-oxononanoate aminotransferase